VHPPQPARRLQRLHARAHLLDHPAQVLGGALIVAGAIADVRGEGRQHAVVAIEHEARRRIADQREIGEGRIVHHLRRSLMVTSSAPSNAVSGSTSMYCSPSKAVPPLALIALATTWSKPPR